MCGLVGAASSQLTDEHLKFMKGALIADTLRGSHSTGIALLNDNTAIIHKTTQEGYSFTNSKPYADMEVTTRKQKGTTAIIGHNRFATLGGITAKTAHPFRHNDVTGAHNGTLWDHDHLAGGKGKDFEVDSEAVMYALGLAAPDLASDVLEKLWGAYALTWHDKRDNTLNFARNNERTLFIATSTSGKTVLWASEKLMLQWLIERSFRAEQFTIDSLPVGQQWSYELDEDGSLEKTRKVTHFQPDEDYGMGGNWRHWSSPTPISPSAYSNPRPKQDRVSDAVVGHKNAFSIDPVESYAMKMGQEKSATLKSFAYYTKGGRYGRAIATQDDGHEIIVQIGMYDDEYVEGKTIMFTVPASVSGYKNEDVLFVTSSLWYYYEPRGATPPYVNLDNTSLAFAEYEQLASQGCGFCADDLPLSKAKEMSLLYCKEQDDMLLCPECTLTQPWSH